MFPTRTLRRILGAALFVLLISSLVMSSTAGAARQAEATNEIRIIEVSGLIDPVIKDFLLKELTRAEDDEILSVVLQLNSKGSILSDEDLNELARRLADSPLIVAIWVGPSGSSALGGAAELVSVADVVGISFGSRVGEIGVNTLSGDLGPAFGDSNAKLLDSYIGTDDAIELGISVGDRERASLLNTFLTSIDGFEPLLDLEAADAGVAPFTENQFLTLPLVAQAFHTAASPEVAYLSFVGGLALLLFELYTAGVGVAGLIGAFMTVMGTYGLAFLPTRSWAIAAILLSVLALAIDIQTNIPRLYTVVGVVLFTIGSVGLYDGVSLSWITLGVGIVGVILYAYTGMPSMVRTRFSTPTIGRRWMIGEVGLANSEIDPEGTVLIRDVPWRAVTNRATPLADGDQIRVTGLDRLILQVEPLEGGAKDYRER